MKKIISSGLVIILLVLPIVSADIITPGFKPVKTTNTITNIEDFSDYLFISGPKNGLGPMCYVQIVEGDGTIKPDYKFCTINVFAVEKSYFDQEKIDYFNDDNINYGERESTYLNYLDSDKVTLVIENIDHYNELPITSTKKEIKNEYTIDKNLLNATKNTNIKRNSLIYIYVLISILALIIISTILFLIYRKRK